MMKKLQRNQTKKSHSWWWDSHINPKNSKWLAENLEKMDAQVKEMLKLIEEEGDSFAKKAEIYYQHRPMLIDHVENFYRMYRALAERYDHVTGELRKNIPSSMQSQCSDDVSGSDSELDEAKDEHEIENENEKNISYLLNQRNIELEAELREAREKLSALEAKNTRCQCACGDVLNLKLCELEEKMQASQLQILNLQKDLEEKTSSLESLKEVISEKEPAVSATKKKSETLEDAMAHENLADELQKLSESNAALENKMASMEAQLKQAEADKAGAFVENEKQFSELNQDIASLKSKLERPSSEKAKVGRRKPKQFLGWMPGCCITAAPLPLVQSTSRDVPKHP